MKHLPYENWILDEPKLKLEEVNISFAAFGSL